MIAFPVVLSAPSGAGKTTIYKRLMAERADVGYSVSCTTRAPRPGEVDGVDYHFLSPEEFSRRREAGEFAGFDGDLGGADLAHSGMDTHVICFLIFCF